MNKIILSLGMLLSSLLMIAQPVMNPNLLWQLGRVSLEDIKPDGSEIIYSVTTFDIDENKGEKNLYTLKTQGEVKPQLFQDISGISTGRYVGNTGYVAYTKGGQLYLADKTGSYQATEVKGGLSDVKIFALRDRIRVLFTTQVEDPNSMQPDYRDPLPKANYRLYDDLMYRHWNYWKPENLTHIAFLDIPLNEVNQSPKVSNFTDINHGEPFNAPTPPFGGSDQFDLSPDGRYIVYSAKKMRGKDFATSTNSELYLYDIQNKSTQNISLGLKGYDQNPSFSPDGKFIAFLSMENDGYESDIPRLFLYDVAKGSYHLISEQDYLHDVVWASNNELYVTIDEEATQPIYKYTLNLKRMSLAKREAFSTGQYNYYGLKYAGKNLVAMRMDMNHAAEVFTFDAKGNPRALTQVNTQLFNKIAKPTVEKRMVKTSDGKDMLVWVILPPNFDTNKKYPVLLYCQGGPQSAVSQFYSFRWNFQVMASQGYVVVAPNRRGLPGFGKEWNEAISKDWGGQPMRDYLAAIDDVAKEPWADENKMGAVGASYGGYSVYQLAGIHEGRFKALISHCGLFHMESWYGTTEELFFADWDLGGNYWQKPQPKAYTDFSPHLFVDKWTAPLLVIHGELDFRVPVEQGLQAFQAARLRDIPAKLLLFPDEGHWVLKPQNALVWHSEFFGWLDTYLK